MQAVIPCGGLATRLGARAAETPKFLLDVAGRPFAFWKLERLARAGFREVVLCVGHLGDAVRAAVGDGARFGLAITYADEGAALLGTWGALRAAGPRLAPELLVTYGDSLLPIDEAGPIEALRAAPGALGAMAVWRNEGAIEPSNAAVEAGRVCRFAASRADAVDDPGAPLSFIDYGAIALRREAVLAGDAPPPAELGVLFAALASAGRLVAVEVPDRFYEIGSPAGLADTEAAVRAGVFGPWDGA